MILLLRDHCAGSVNRKLVFNATRFDAIPLDSIRFDLIIGSSIALLFGFMHGGKSITRRASALGKESKQCLLEVGAKQK